MPDSGQLHDHIRALDKGDDTARREALRSLRHYEEQEWAAAPVKLIRSLIESLHHHLLGEMNQPFIRLEVLTILGSLGPRSKHAVPQLIELLKEGVPDAVREAAATALGKIGSESMKRLSMRSENTQIVTTENSNRNGKPRTWELSRFAKIIQTSRRRDIESKCRGDLPKVRADS